MTDEHLLRQLKGLKPPPGYEGEVGRMAAALRLDLQSAVEQGDLTLTGIYHMMNRCSACGDRGGCHRWLAGRTGIATAPYNRCLNAKFLAALCKPGSNA